MISEAQISHKEHVQSGEGIFPPHSKQEQEIGGIIKPA